MPPFESILDDSTADMAIARDDRALTDLVADTVVRLLDHRETDPARALDDLYHAVSARFAFEEEQMRNAYYDKLGAHKCDHERLLDQLRDLIDAAPARPDAAADQLSYTFEAWLADHLRIHDARLQRRLSMQTC
jgi:hemerythrin